MLINNTPGFKKIDPILNAMRALGGVTKVNAFPKLFMMTIKEKLKNLDNMDGSSKKCHSQSSCTICTW